jgi:hypothetical protein
MADVGLIAVPRTKTYNYGDGASVTQERLAVDVTNYTRNQIIQLLRSTAANETQQQINLGNPPDIVIADNLRGQPYSAAVRRVEVMFGTRLPIAALSTLKAILRRTIERATRRKSGALSDTATNWGYVYIRNGVGGPVPIGSKGGLMLAAGDALVLRPQGVPHSTVANIRVREGRGIAHARNRAAKGLPPGKGKAGLGFLAQAARAAQRDPIFAGYKVVVRFTAHTVPGELWRRRMSGTILITPKTGRASRSRRR